eukprot:14380405-Alexandrium_andersonii.AAC.1
MAATSRMTLTCQNECAESSHRHGGAHPTAARDPQVMHSDPGNRVLQHRDPIAVAHTDDGRGEVRNAAAILSGTGP